MIKSTLSRKYRPDDCEPLREAVARGQVRMFALARGHYPGESLGQNSLPGLLSIGYWDAAGTQTWGLPMHRNEGIEICCLLAGETAFGTDRESHLLQSGDITITRPWQRHQLGDPQIRACRLFWLILDVGSEGGGSGGWTLPAWIGPDAATRLELLRILRRNQACHFHDPTRTIRNDLERSLPSLNRDTPLRIAQAAALINDILLRVCARLAEGCDNTAGDPHGYHRTIHDFFIGLERDRDTAAEPWTVADMARACRVGVTYLTAASRELFNATPGEHLCLIRLAHAEHLLTTEPSHTVTDVAFACGFNSSQYFATRFRRQYGHAPLAHRDLP